MDLALSFVFQFSLLTIQGVNSVNGTMLLFPLVVSVLQELSAPTKFIAGKFFVPAVLHL